MKNVKPAFSFERQRHTLWSISLYLFDNLEFLSSYIDDSSCLPLFHLSHNNNHIPSTCLDPHWSFPSSSWMYRVPPSWKCSGCSLDLLLTQFIPLFHALGNCQTLRMGGFHLSLSLQHVILPQFLKFGLYFCIYT